MYPKEEQMSQYFQRLYDVLGETIMALPITAKGELIP